MIFEKRFIFETRGTKARRFFRNIIFIVLLIGATFSLSCLLFIHVSNEENLMTQNMLINTSPNLIVVFTGDAGRIPYALSILKRNPQASLLITGVSAKYTLEKFKSVYQEDFPEIDFSKIPITLDSQAANTVENVIYTLRHIDLNPIFKDILIISHDYHILRAKIILNTINLSPKKFNFYYLGLKTDYTQYRNLKILFQETFKMIKTLGFLMLWEKQDESFMQGSLDI